jgi:hypothetical protein
MNINEIQQEIVWRVGNRTDLANRSMIWLNDAYFELLMSPRFTFFELDRQFQFSTVPMQRVYDVVAMVPDLWIILDFRNETMQQKIARYHWSEFDRKWRVFAIPVRYARFASTVEFDPTPDKVYDLTMRYRLRPPELIQGGVHLLTREWDEVIITMAVQKGWEALEQWEKSQAQKQIVEMQLSMREEPHSLEDADSETTIWPAKQRW